MKIKVSGFLLSGVFSLLVFCSDSGEMELTTSNEPEVLTNAEIEAVKENLKTIEATPVEDNEIAVLQTSAGIIKFKFYPEKAPNHAANFKKLANSGFYDWTTFHRVIPGFMIQGGDINSKNAEPGDDGTGSPGYNVNAEFNDIKHVRGIVSTARSTDPNSAGSQFFIMHGDAPQLDGQYTVFGEVIEGIEIVDSIVNSAKDARDRPIENVYIIKARVVKS